MSKYLVIVESPTKIKTLRKFLGEDFAFESSLGHIRDLPKKSLGIDVENEFLPQYVVVEGKSQVVEKLKRAAKAAERVYLCPDPDREGEAIAWHIAALLDKHTDLQRVTFNSITKQEVLNALERPRQIDMDLVNAQQARRILDRLVGYTVSPVVAKRLQGADRFKGSTSLSAGRVQSVALKLVVDREREIEQFRPVEYWLIWAHLLGHKKDQQLQAILWEVDGKRIEKEPSEGKSMSIHNAQIAQEIEQRLQKANYSVTRVDRKEKKRHPVPPFTTSTLQQEASRHFGFSASRTMRVAQSLYEGVDLGSKGSIGLVTYIRTDSVRIAPEALGQARKYIESTFGYKSLAPTPRQFTSRKSAQDAHECIRPTDVELTPERVGNHLESDQLKLYGLIWKRLVSSQMASAEYDTVSIDVLADPGIVLRATGSILTFSGFLAVYEEKVDEEGESSLKTQLPQLQVGESLDLKRVETQQSFTKPPPRFTEASLVKELEKSGIGRPSTYAAIMGKIQSKAYSVKEANRLKPTDLGCLLAAALEKHFAMIMDIGFTASMEDQLEQVSGQRKEWRVWLSEFWAKFYPLIGKADQEMTSPREDTDRVCPKCGKHLQKIWYRSKFFLGCSTYPDCDFRSSIEAMDFDKSAYASDFNWDQKCPQCQGAMVVRHGKFGTFLGCEKYPDCKGVIQVPKQGEALEQTKTPCPAVDCPGALQARRSRFGKTFYSCTTYPSCDVIGPSPSAVLEKYRDHPRTPYKKAVKDSPKKGGKTNKIADKKPKAKAKAKTKSPSKKAIKQPSDKPLLKVSQALINVLKTAPANRQSALKGVWDYIKEHKLQDSKDRRQIILDDNLKGVFGNQDRIQMMKIAGGLTPHLNV